MEKTPLKSAILGASLGWTLLAFFSLPFFAHAAPLAELAQRDIRRVAILVGTFDPLHIGHERIVEHILSDGKADAVVIIPQDLQRLNAGIYKSDSSPSVDRLELLQVRYGQSENVFVPESIDHYGGQLLFGALRWLKTRIGPRAELISVYGADNYESLSFRLVDRFLSGTRRSIVIPRYGHALPTTTRWRFLGKPLETLSVPLPIDVSSTRIRQIISDGTWDEIDLEGLVSPQVAAYLKHKHGAQVPKQRGRVLIYPGTFDPFTSAHEQEVTQAAREQGFDQVMILPVGDAYYSARAGALARPRVFTYAERLDAIRATFRDRPGFSVARELENIPDDVLLQLIELLRRTGTHTERQRFPVRNDRACFR